MNRWSEGEGANKHEVKDESKSERKGSWLRGEEY